MPELYARLIASPGEASRDYLLYGADTPNTWKVATLLEELKLPYDVVTVDIMNDEQKQSQYVKLNPNGRTPTLVDLTTPSNPVAVFESGAIMLHIAENYEAGKPFLPSAERNSAIQWLFWVNAGLGPMAGQCSHFRYYAPQVEPAPYDHSYSLDRYSREFDRLISVLDRRVGATGSFLAGDHYGIADSMRAASCAAPDPSPFALHHHAQPVA